MGKAGDGYANRSLLGIKQETLGMSMKIVHEDDRGYKVYEVTDEEGNTHYELYDPNGNQINGAFPSMDDAVRQVPPAPRPPEPFSPGL